MALLHAFESSGSECAGESHKVGPHIFCLTCGRCNMETCRYYQTHGDLPVTFSRSHTQKVKGIMALASLKMPYIDRLSFFIIQNPEQTIDLIKQFPATTVKFARPCPSVPRHGFLDSRCITTEDDLKSLLAETLTLDPNGEVLLMPYIKASHNMVWTPGLLTVGLGNDGATSGKDAITIPTSQTLPFVIHTNSEIKQAFKEAGIISSPYLEFVVRQNKYAINDIYVTQLRDGPALEFSKDYIPKQVKVTTVLNANDYPDLLKWEEVIHKATKEKGTVVYHRGGALSSHYGVHCKINEVPYITSFKPDIGQTLKPTDSVRHGLDASLVLDGIAEGLVLPLDLRRYAQYAVFTLACLHNLAFFTRDESRYVGIAIAILLRLGIAACKGEARHNKYGTIGKDIRGLCRGEIYTKVLNDFKLGIRRLGYVEYTFRNGFWESNMGGKAWAECTKANIELFNLVITLYKSLGKKGEEHEFKRLLEGYNKNINQAHNNGWY
ncbi:MAG: hypothetical protein AAB721_01225, partial [Patescibacteria group bacterium]